MSVTSQCVTPADRKPRAKPKQPLQAASFSDALLKLQTLQDLCGMGRTSLYARIKAGELSVVRIGARCTRVRASEAQRFLRALGQEVQA